MPASSSNGYSITPDRALLGRYLFRYDNPQFMKISRLGRWVGERKKKMKKKNSV